MVEIARISKLKNGWNRTNFLIEKWLKLREFQNSWNCTNFEIENDWKCTKFKTEK